MAAAEKHVFPDANILIHFPALDGLDWVGICDAKSIVIHMTQAVLRELNKIKDTGHTKTIRRRAATVQKRLKELLKASHPARLGPGVTVQFHSYSAVAKHHVGLDDRVSDDALISAILTFIENSGQTPCLMTDDSGLGLMVKAAEWKITVLEPPEQLRLPSEVDPDQKERDQLRKRVAQLEQSQPQLDLCFTPGGQLLKLAPLVSDVSTDTQSRLAALKKKHAKLPLPTPKPDRPKPKGLRVEDLLGQDRTFRDYILSDPKKLTAFNHAIDKFLSEAERVITYNATIRKRMVRIQLRVTNSGQVPAKDVLVDMHFPDGLQPLASEDLRELFKSMPSAPQDPTILPLGLGLGRDFASSISSLSVPRLRNPDEPSLFIEKTNSFNVRWHVPKLRQGYASAIDPIFVLFDDRPFSFPITYTIVADNSHDIAKGTLNVVVVQSTSDCNE